MIGISPDVIRQHAENMQSEGWYTVANALARIAEAIDLDFASKYIDQLNFICERHGCEPGTDRLEWLDKQLSKLSRKPEVDDRPGGFDGPTAAD